MKQFIAFCLLIGLGGFLQIGGKAGVGGKAGIGGGGNAKVNNIVAKQKCPSAGITHVSNTSVTCTWPSNLTNGSTIWIYAEGNDGTATFTVSDTVNSFTPVGWTTLNSGSAGSDWNLWCASNTSSSALTVTVSFSAGSADIYVGGLEATGATCTVDTQVSNGSTTGLTSPSFTTTNCCDIVFIVAAAGSGTTTPTVGTIAGSAATLVGATNAGANSPAWEYRLVSTTLAAQTGNFATGDSSTNLLQVAAYKSQ